MPEPWEGAWRDYYALLECAQDASPRQIRSSFRRLARVYHPDVSHTDGALFKLIAEAYEALSDPRRRLAYDRAYVRVKHGFAPQQELTVEPAELVVRAQMRRMIGNAFLRGISPEAGSSLDVSVRDPDVELKEVTAEWMTPRRPSLHIRWQAQLIGQARPFEVIYRAGGLSAVQRIDARAPRFVLHETISTSAGRRTYVLGLRSPWFEASRERFIVIPFGIGATVVFGGLLLKEHNHRGSALVVALVGGALATLVSLLFLNAYLATSGASTTIRRILPSAAAVVLVMVVEEIVRLLL